jgi:putative toxin-antitoxin system antitoxin component (TIGR02293 family)
MAQHEEYTMASADARTSSAALTAPAVRSPTAYLFGGESGNLSTIRIYLLTKDGFHLKDVQDMLSSSALYSTQKVLSRIIGKSVRTIQRQGSSNKPAQLNSQQSAVAFQYAKVLEHAIAVFGTQRGAEEWLGNPCKYLEGGVPLDLIDNPVGFQAVEDYLERIELGVYQ